MDYYLLVAGVSFLYVFCKAFQSMNQVFKKYAWIPLFSYLLSFAEVFLWSTVAINAVERDYVTAALIAIALGTGGWIGSLTSITLHPRMTGKGYGKRT